MAQRDSAQSKLTLLGNGALSARGVAGVLCTVWLHCRGQGRIAPPEPASHARCAAASWRSPTRHPKDRKPRKQAALYHYAVAGEVTEEVKNRKSGAHARQRGSSRTARFDAQAARSRRDSAWANTARSATTPSQTWASQGRFTTVAGRRGCRACRLLMRRCSRCRRRLPLLQGCASSLGGQVQQGLCLVLNIGLDGVKVAAAWWATGKQQGGDLKCQDRRQGGRAVGMTCL